jgi:GNAT superfamily N-acetyltransferase
VEFKIENAVVSDVSQILSLIKELAEFENEPEQVEITEEELRNDGFGSNPLYHCFVARDPKTAELLGMALVYFRYSTWKGKSIHLEDLIVKKEVRGNGIGTALLDHVTSYAHQMGVRRLCWEVLDWNTLAIELYESKGAQFLKNWHIVQMDQQTIAQNAQKANE